VSAVAVREGLAACVAHFHLPDRHQLGLLRAALARADRVLVFVTRPFQAPTARHPFGWRVRADMLLASVDGEERARIVFEPVREHWDVVRTVKAVQVGLKRHGSGDRVHVAWSGEAPDAEDLPRDWLFEPVGDTDDAGEKRLDALYLADDPQAAWRGMEAELAPGVRDVVVPWLSTPEFDRLRDERRQVAHEKQVWSAVPWPVTLVTVDALVHAGGHVLLIQRGRHPGKGLWALPGGFLETGDTVLRSALRELAEETGLPLSPRGMAGHLRGSQVFDHPRRSQRGRIVTHTFFFDLGPGEPPPVKGGDDAAAADWIPVAQLASLETRLHDDHFEMLDRFLGLTQDP
jgi:bifunctional NMN adenylyltransferase/nudix hydrolase